MSSPSPEELTDIWNRTVGERFPLGLELARQFLSIDVDEEASSIAPGGLVVAKRWGSTGFIAALVVEPHVQGSRLGKRLLRHAVNTFHKEGVRDVRLGGDRLHLMPGVPEPGPLDLCRQMGFVLAHAPLADFRGSLKAWSPSTEPAVIRAASEWEEVLDLLGREFPGRLAWEAEESVRRGGDPAGYLLLDVATTAAGFARIQHFEAGTPRLGVMAPSVYWTDLLEPAWGGIGPLGVAAELRGRGLGLRLLEAAMLHLQKQGVLDLVVDGARTDGLISRAGLTPWKTYRPGRLELA